MKTLLALSVALAALPFCGGSQPAMAQEIGVARTKDIAPEAKILEAANALALQARIENRDKLLRQIRNLQAAKPADKARNLAIIVGSLSHADFGEGNARAFDLSLQLAQIAIESDDFGLNQEVWMLRSLDNQSAELPRSPQQKTALAALIMHSLQSIKQLKSIGPPTEDVYMNPPLPLTLPLNQIFFSGMSPSAIKDPEARAQYEKIIARNNRNVKRLNDYHEAENLERNWGDSAEKYLRNFAATNEGAAALDELLQKYDIDAASVARIEGASGK